MDTPQAYQDRGMAHIPAKRNSPTHAIITLL